MCQAKRLAAWAVLVGLATGAAEAQQIYLAANTLIVSADGGGYLARRSDRIAQMRATGQRVEIRGTCISACTMYLSLPNVCVTPSAVLGFHGPSENGRPLPPRDFEYWSQVMAANYAEPLRSWFLSTARYNTSGYYQISGAQLIRMGYQQC
ncbi:hypothetical protein [Rhodobacter maris]|nr:hypothetical protein [Rhodobacter maris]